MAAKPDDDDEGLPYYGPHISPEDDLKRFLPKLRGDRHYLHGDHKELLEILSPKTSKDENTIKKSDPVEVTESAKRALNEGKLQIAENLSVKAIRTNISKAQDKDLKRFLPKLRGDRHYLHGDHKGLLEILAPLTRKDENTIKKSDPVEVTESAKRALNEGKLQIAENLSVKAIRTNILDHSSRKSPEPYFYLAEVLQRKAEDKDLKLLKKQRFLLQAAALYNFVRNCLKSRDTDVELSKELLNFVPRQLLDIQNKMITSCGGNPLQSRFDADCKKNELTSLRNEIRESLDSTECQSSSSNQGRLNECEARQEFRKQTKEVEKLSITVSERMKQFFASIIDECLALLGTPSYDYEVIVFGSLARNETTPYSDFEWAILTSSEDEECKVFFRNLTNLVHLQVINLGETILPSMNIDAINGDWFYDDVTPRGVSFDGLLPQACKIPLGNMQDFELIHTPKKMAEFQSNEWYRENWSLADTLMTLSPLRSEKSVLVEAYRKEMDEILSRPCDSESCEHDASSCACPTRRSCRGLRVLEKDLSRYGDIMTGNNELDEGKFYDVKKEIYRLTDRVIAALAKCYEVEATSAFAVLDELYEKEVISPEARDNLASASAIAIRLRLSTYSKAGKQGEELSSISNNKTEKKAPVDHDKELFHFFFVAIPLYDELRQFTTSGNIPSSFANLSFFNDSDMTMGQIYCRLLKYDEAIEYYKRAFRENPDNLSAEIRQVLLALFSTSNTQDSDKVRKDLDNFLGKIVKNFSQLDINVDRATMELTPLMNRVDKGEYRQLIEGLFFASEIYCSSKYSALAHKILKFIAICDKPSKSLMRENMALVLLEVSDMRIGGGGRLYAPIPENLVDNWVFTWTILIEEEGVSTKSIAWLNNLGEFLSHQGKVDKAYRCFQRALRMAHLLYEGRPNIKMMTSLHYLGMMAKKLKMFEDCKFYWEYLVQRFESFHGTKIKLLIKEIYLGLSTLLSYPAEESLRYAERGLKVTTGTKNEKELVLNCFLYCVLARELHFLKSPERAWEAVLNALACQKDSISIQGTIEIIDVVEVALRMIAKSKEGIALLEKELQKLTLKSQAQEKFFYLKALAKHCLEQGLTAEAKNYYSQAIDIPDENRFAPVFNNLECRIGIVKAAVMEDSALNEKQVLDKAFSSVTKLPASFKSCSFLRKIGKLYLSIDEIGNAGLCCSKAFHSAKEFPASDEKLSSLLKTGRLCERISDFALARQCYNQARNTYKEEVYKKLLLDELYLEMKLGDLTKKITSIDLLQRVHYDRAADILRQHVAAGDVDLLIVAIFRALAEAYKAIDQNEEIGLLLEGLEASEMVDKTDKLLEMVTTLLKRLSRAYYSLGDMQNSKKYKERMELEHYSSNPFLERILKALRKWALTSSSVPSDSIKRVSDSFLSFLNDKAHLLNITGVKTIAAKCLTFIAVLFSKSRDFENAKSLSEKASQLFDEVQESVDNENDQCRKTCNLMKRVLGPEFTLLPEILEFWISFVNLLEISSSLCDDSVSVEEEINWFLQKYEHAGDEKRVKEVKEQAQSTSVEEQNKLSPQLMVQLHLEALEHYKSKREFRLAAEIHASLQLQQLSFYENYPNYAEEKLTSNAIEKPFASSSKPEDASAPDTKTVDHFMSQMGTEFSDCKLSSIGNELQRSNPFGCASGLERYFFIQAVLQWHSKFLKYFESKHFGEATENNASVQAQPQQLNENSPFRGEEKLISDAIKAKDKYEPSNAIRFLDLALQLQFPEAQSRRIPKILKLRGECFLSMGHFRSAAIDFTKADALYSIKTIDNQEDLVEYSEVLIGLIKSEILCNNVKAAWLVCGRGIKLAMDHELKETIHQQAAKLLNLGFKCINILLEQLKSGEYDENERTHLYQEALSLKKQLKKTTTRTTIEVQELWKKIFPFAVLTKEENENERIYQENQDVRKINLDFLSSVSIKHVHKKQPGLFMNLSIQSSLAARSRILFGDIEESKNFLNVSLMAFFLDALPDFLYFYEKFLPLLQAITATKSSAPDQSRSPFQLAVDMCTKMLTKQNKSSSYVNQFLTTTIIIYRSLGQAQEAMVVAEIGLEINDLMSHNSDSNKLNNRCRMLLHLAQIHQQNSSNPAFNMDEEHNHAVDYYLRDRGRKEDIVLCKDLSYANFLCERKRYADAHAVLEDMRNLGKLLWNKYVYVEYFSCAFYGAGVEKSVKTDGELFTTVGDVLYNLMVRAYVGMEKKKEAVATCETLTDVNLLDVHEASFGKRPSCKPYLVGDCHHELLSLLSEEDQHQFENCDFPLSSVNLAKLYYMLGEYEMASKYFPKSVESSELVDFNGGDESISFFLQFLDMLQDKEDFLGKPFNNQCEILQTCSFANQYYLFRSLGIKHAERENIDAAIQCYERCIELNEDFTYDQNIVAALSELYQTKALMVALENEDSRTAYMDRAWKVFQKLFQKTAELTTFVELSFASLLRRLDRYQEAVEHFYKVIKRADSMSVVTFGNVKKPLADVYLRREIEGLGGRVVIPQKVLSAYELILTLMKLKQIKEAEKTAFSLESVVKEYPLSLPVNEMITHSMAGYAYKIIGNKEKAAEILVSVLENNPGHPPVIEALESCGGVKIKCDHHYRGCPHVVYLEDLPRHVAQCEFAPAMCGNEGCGMDVNKSEKENHEKSLCPFRIERTNRQGQAKMKGKQVKNPRLTTQENITESESTQENITESESTQENITESESTQENITESESTHGHKIVTEDEMEYRLFASLGRKHAERENIDAAIQCYERCIELDEEFTFGQEVVATLSNFYQARALTVDLDNKDSRKIYMNRAWELLQKLFQKTTQLTEFVEFSFASLLTRLDRCEEAVGYFFNIVEGTDCESFAVLANVHKPLVDVYLCREIEAYGGHIPIPIKVLAAYELILTLMKLNQIGEAREAALSLESIVKKYPLSFPGNVLINLLMAGYAYLKIGNKEKAAEIFVSVLDIIPEHPTVPDALKSCGVLKITCSYRRFGCPDVVRLEDLPRHVDQCEFVRVMCGNEGCGIVVNKSEKENHEKSLCQFRIEKPKRQEQAKMKGKQVIDPCLTTQENITESESTQENITESESTQENITESESTQEDKIIKEDEMEYLLFASFGRKNTERENIDAAILCYERCVELDDDFSFGQDIVATLSELYQTKAVKEKDSRMVYMDLSYELFRKLFRKTVELTTFVELSFASLLTRLDRCEEAVDHFYKVIERANFRSFVTFQNVDKPLVNVYLRHEIEALGGRVIIPQKVVAAYELILTFMKLKQLEEAEKTALSLESVVKEYPLSLPVNELITHSMAGYAYKIIGNKEKAAEILVSVLENNPGHPPVVEALESCGGVKIKCDHHDRGCPDVVCLEDLPRHVTQCEFAPVMCGNEGCEMVVNKSEKESHEKSLCQLRIDKPKRQEQAKMKGKQVKNPRLTAQENITESESTQGDKIVKEDKMEDNITELELMQGDKIVEEDEMEDRQEGEMKITGARCEPEEPTDEMQKTPASE